MIASPRVVIYSRYSSDLQSAASIEDQIRLCRERAAREGWNIFGSYEDRATSGATLLRAGIQQLLRDARDGAFDIVLAEGLDRLSRDQADIAAIYRDLSFAGTKIFTLAEGEISELHIGLKGTMNQLYLTDLAAKTRRGLRGRVAVGKSAGGLAYGYRVLRKLREDGEVERGDREIIEEEAAIVRRIFTSYADGMSPQKIAAMLNEEGIPGPRGNAWDKSTIHGNPKRATGILNNVSYIGEIAWNRQTYRKDPRSGKRQSRPNAEEEAFLVPAPALRIVDQDLWDRVKVAQEQRSLKIEDKKAWQTRKPKFLLTGLMQCGCCGGGVSTVARDRFGCSNARNKGAAYCTNRATISRADLEGRILTALSERLMDPDLVKVFCEEYVAERNRLRATHATTRAEQERELKKVIKDQDQLVDALLKGVPAERIKARLEALEARQKQLEAEVAAAPAPDPVRLHPKMAETYRSRVADLVSLLGDTEHYDEAREAIRALIDKVVLSPMPGPGKRPVPHIRLHGALAGILSLSLGGGANSGKGLSGKTKTALDGAAFESAVFLVAGAGFEPAAFRL